VIKQHDLGGDLMKIVFLDIDGVLNHACTKERFQSYIGIDEGNLRNFVEFIKRARAKEETEVVLTSSWREDVNWEGDAVENGYQYVYHNLKGAYARYRVISYA